MTNEYVQNWSEQERKDLLDFILANIKVEKPLDVCVGGSRVYGVPARESDMDVIVYIPDGEKRPSTHALEYDGVRICASYQFYPSQWRRLLGDKYLFSIYSLVNGILYQGDRDHELTWMREVKKINI